MESDPTARNLVAALPESGTVVLVGWPEQSLAALARRGDVESLVVDTDGDAHDVVRRLGRADADAAEVPARSVGAAVLAADVVLLDALAVGPDAALVPAGSLAAAAVARTAGVPVWLVAGVGRLLPRSMWDALSGRWASSTDPLVAPEEILTLDLVDRLAGVAGVVEVAEGLRRTDCPIAPELFRLVG
jgi:translation initiation factor 2B subunit (eIF-2B alpha/beta/delta family)